MVWCQPELRITFLAPTRALENFPTNSRLRGIYCTGREFVKAGLALGKGANNFYASIAQKYHSSIRCMFPPL